MNLKCNRPNCLVEFKLTEAFKVKFAGKNQLLVCPKCKMENVYFIPLFEKKKPEITEPIKKNILAKMPCLILEGSDNHSKQIFELRIGDMIIGRLRNNDGDIIPDIGIITNDSFISNKHVLINTSKLNDSWKIEIQNLSRNGLYLNRDADGHPDLEDNEKGSIVISENDFFTIGTSKLILALPSNGII